MTSTAAILSTTPRLLVLLAGRARCVGSWQAVLSNVRSYRLLAAIIVAAVCTATAGSWHGAAAMGKHGPAPRVVYVALGASDTVGVGTPHPRTQNWTAVLARHLPPGARYVNLGISGITASVAVTAELPAAVAARPTVATVWLAVNDLVREVPPARYGASLDRLLAGLQRSHARVFVGNVPDLRRVPDFALYVDPRTLNRAVLAYNRTIAAVAARHGATVVNLYDASKDLKLSSYVSSDGFHPNVLGYQRLASVFYRVMHRQGAI